MKKNIIVALAASLFAGSNISAQVFGDKDMILLASQSLSLGYQDTVLYVPYLSNTDVVVESDASWLTAEVMEQSKKIRLAVEASTSPEKRRGVVQVTNADKSIVRTFTVDQTKENYAVYAPSNKVSVASATASSYQPGEGIERSYDGSTSTLWHSSYGGVNFPVTLTYNFVGVEQIDFLRYIPRTSGKNGCFQKVEIWAKTAGSDEYVQMGTYDFGGNNSPYEVYFDQPVLKPTSIQFKVLSATTSETNNYASCAEMEFYRNPVEGANPNLDIFATDLWDELKPGVTQEDIDALTNPYSKFVAQQLYTNRDEFIKDRIATYECVLSPEQLSALWNTPGKYYDHLQGVTGINISKGTCGVAVSGLPEGKSATLKVVAWYAGEIVQNDKGEWVGAGPAEYSYTLQNGINTINYTFDYDGLAYIAYFADSQEEETNTPPIKVHFINGSINGYLSPDRSNEQLDTVLMNAKNRCIDLVGEKVHSIWQVSGMRNYCKNSDNNGKGYVQFMNVLDTLVGWEHHLLGLEKYGRVPKNRTCAYVNYTYYMFQGNYGVSFKFDTEGRVLNCNTIMKNDGDAIWGLSHEWGHQHQMQPYFCWAGLGESSNNMNSCENVLRMGYHDDYHAGRIKNAWVDAYSNFFEKKDATSTSEPRLRAYQNLNRFNWSSAVQTEIQNQYKKYYKNGAWQIPSIASDPEHALSTNEVYVEQNTAPFYMLHNYFSYILPTEMKDYTLVDYQLDLYEALRQNDEPKGSAVEPGKTDVDKYELLASAQNGNKNDKYDEFVAKYPNSCWVTNKYIRKGAVWTENSVPFIFNYIRKASRICGYNLFDYFDKFGFMRTIIMTIDDYGYKDYVMMEDMKAEFKADMEALNLKKIDAEMMEKIAHSSLPVYKTPSIPNDPVTK